MIVPRATYRLQLRNGVDFAAAAELAPYLARLGVSHLYASPIFAARANSTHGYDVTDFSCPDPALGGMPGFERLVEALKRNGLGLILDFVPNHMAASVENQWWRDTLERGEASRFAAVFDIDWTRFGGRVLVPVLGDLYGRVLERGELSIEYDGGSFAVRYGDMRFPIAPETRSLLTGASPGEAATALSQDRDRLHVLLEAQHYRLCHWRLAANALNYRRFFDVNDLVGIRVDDPEIFDLVHRFVLSLVRDGLIEGLRLDHIDGLKDPTGYLQRLHRKASAALGGERFYIAVEKILGINEELPAEWPVAGTTGYEFANLVTGLQVEREGLNRLRYAYGELTGDRRDFAEIVEGSKRQVLELSFFNELGNLVESAVELAQDDLVTRDIGPGALRMAITEVLVAFPVYRTYVTGCLAAGSDLAVIGEVLSAAGGRIGEESKEALAFVRRLLTGTGPDGGEFAARLQQLTGALMAKAVEDTAFYRYLPLLALNEVGGDPGGTPPSVEQFHALNGERRRRWPLTMLATATHDTKRGEDARARLAAISHDPEAFIEAVSRWWSMHQPLVSRVGGELAPHPKDAWLFYQSLIGIWPADLDPADGAGLRAMCERLQAFMRKAMREAKERTRWTDIAESYEAAVLEFVGAALDRDRSRAFLAEARAAVDRIAAAGAANGLVQLVLKLTVPGVPDIYNGSEAWDLSLVDPDNRRPVDFERLAAALARAEARNYDWQRVDQGLAKQVVMHRILRLRHSHPALFRDGDYQPLLPDGQAADRAVAFVRGLGEQALLVCALRHGSVTMEELGSSPLPLDGRLATIEWLDVLADRRIGPLADRTLAAVLGGRPAAVLYGESGASAANA